jgi:dipeptidyl-peptidase-3
MSWRRPAVLLFVSALATSACGGDPQPAAPGTQETADTFQYETERFADLSILRCQVPGFEELDLQTKTLLYYLYESTLSGREIMYDQKYRYNLAIKRKLERIIQSYPGDRETDDFEALELYMKRIWFSNGIHHHYSHDKFDPGFSYEAFERYVRDTPGGFPVREGQSVDDFLADLRPVMFDPTVDAKLVDRSAGVDVIAASAVNFYDGLTFSEFDAFYDQMRDPNDATPIWYGLNSRLVKIDGQPVEQVWRVGNMYTEALEEVVYWLELAVPFAQNAEQRDAFEKLIAYYRSGDLEDWDDYNIAWVNDTGSTVDLISGFVEVYNDPIGLRGSFESVVELQDPVATRRIDALAAEAQWFEDNSPIMDEHKKASVTGITAKVINVVSESGDSSPSSPVGINLPNSDWIRREHGSKSVSLANIDFASEQRPGGTELEFAWDQAEIERGELYGGIVEILLTDMHEVIGHASGQLNPGVGVPSDTLRNYALTLEEARADLVALYYMLDPMLVELGLMPSVEAGRISCDRFIRNGLMVQLNRIEPGNTIEEDHMRNRQMIASWAYEQGLDDNVIERRERDGKTYFVVQDYDRLRELFGELLRELQRIKSEGDFEAIRDLVEIHGVQVDPQLHAQVRQRFAQLDLPSFSGYINPRLVAVEEEGEIVDVRIEYPDDFTAQMLEYAQRYAFLPSWN